MPKYDFFRNYLLTLAFEDRQKLEDVGNFTMNSQNIPLWKEIARHFIPNFDFYKERNFELSDSRPMKLVINELIRLAVTYEQLWAFLCRLQVSHLVSFLPKYLDDAVRKRYNSPDDAISTNHLEISQSAICVNPIFAGKIPTYSKAQIVEMTENFDHLIAQSRSSLYKGRDLAGNFVAVKKFTNELFAFKDEERSQWFNANYNILCKLQEKNELHPNIIEGLGACIEMPFCLIFPWYEYGSLQSYIDNNDLDHSWKILIKIAAGSASGLAHFLSLKLYHGDIKPSNILLTSDYVAKLADFDQCPLRPNQMDLTHVTANDQFERAATFMYLPPECRDSNHKMAHSHPRDVYSLALVLLVLLANDCRTTDASFRLHLAFDSIATRQCAKIDGASAKDQLVNSQDDIDSSWSMCTDVTNLTSDISIEENSTDPPDCRQNSLDTYCNMLVKCLNADPSKRLKATVMAALLQPHLNVSSFHKESESSLWYIDLVKRNLIDYRLESD